MERFAAREGNSSLGEQGQEVHRSPRGHKSSTPSISKSRAINPQRSTWYMIGLCKESWASPKPKHEKKEGVSQWDGWDLRRSLDRISLVTPNIEAQLNSRVGLVEFGLCSCSVRKIIPNGSPDLFSQKQKLIDLVKSWTYFSC